VIAPRATGAMTQETATELGVKPVAVYNYAKPIYRALIDGRRTTV
jgi:hypothetical protein